jgi:transcriptional regulator with XRE-family HTH domain
MSTTVNLSRVPTAADPEATRLACSGTVAGTVLRAARLSAHLTQAQLAEAIGVHEASLARWEDGVDPLTAVAYPILMRIEAKLVAAQADPDLVPDLTIAMWCDLVVGAAGASQDISCLMADPTAAEEAFGELLAWCAGGRRPERYRGYAEAGPLVEPGDLAAAVRAIQNLG